MSWKQNSFFLSMSSQQDGQASQLQVPITRKIENLSFTTVRGDYIPKGFLKRVANELAGAVSHGLVCLCKRRRSYLWAVAALGIGSLSQRSQSVNRSIEFRARRSLCYRCPALPWENRESELSFQAVASVDGGIKESPKIILSEASGRS